MNSLYLVSGFSSCQYAYSANLSFILYTASFISECYDLHLGPKHGSRDLRTYDLIAIGGKFHVEYG